MSKDIQTTDQNAGQNSKGNSTKRDVQVPQIPKLSEENLPEIFSLSRVVPFPLTPCFYGESGSGKTARAFKLAQAMKLPLKTLILSACLPEDIGGVLRAEGQFSVWKVPDWVNTPSMLFLDELDKAREDSTAAILSLLTSREIHGEKLHPDTVILCAMQPVDASEFRSTETGKALAARLLWLPVGQSFSARFGEAYSSMDRIPAPPPLGETCDLRAVEFARAAWVKGIDVYDSLYTLVLADALREAQCSVNPATPVFEVFGKASLAREVAGLLPDITPAVAASIARSIAPTCSPEIYFSLLEICLRTENPDNVEAFFSATCEAVNNDPENRLFGDATAEEAVDAYSRMLSPIHAEWAMRQPASIPQELQADMKKILKEKGKWWERSAVKS